MSRVKNVGARIAALAVLVVGLASVSACFVGNSPSAVGCAPGELLCGALCCLDDTHYACESGACRLIGCNTDLQLCGPGCIPITANCCDQQTGRYCGTGEVCCAPSACIPIGTSCCGNGNFCPVGKVCCNGGTQCC